MTAMCAAARGCKAWAKGEGCVSELLSAGDGALMEAHKGQSSVWLEAATPSPSPLFWPCTTSFILPVLVQTKSITCGLTTGEAMATPIDNANHTSTKRVSWIAWRSFCMPEILTGVDQHQPTKD